VDESINYPREIIDLTGIIFSNSHASK